MVRLSSAFESPGSAGPNAPSPETLGNEIAELAAQIHVATHRLLLKLRAFDAMDGWAAGGFRSTAEWLSWRTGISPGAARERVRVARALGELPRISAAMERGEVSYSKARALTRVADPESERRLLDFALHATAAQVERLVGGWAGLDREARNQPAQRPAGQDPTARDQRAQDQTAQDQTAQDKTARDQSAQDQTGRGSAARPEAPGHGAAPPNPPCHLHLTPNPDTGSWRIQGELEPEVAMVLHRALAMAAEALYRGTPSGTEPPSLPQRQAEAMGLLAEAALRAGVEVAGRRTTGRADRFQVILHVSAETPDGGAAAPADHPPADQCLACDASRVLVTHAADGSILDVGRRTRIVPPALRRALELRDGGCAHPHCANRICDAHHIVPWQEGGATSLENLVLLCRRHHRAVHRGELQVEVRSMEVKGVQPQGEQVQGEQVQGAKAAGEGRASHALFRDAKGEVLMAVPPLPALCDDPVTALRRDHAARGLDPATLAAYPKWDGTPLNLGLALDWLWRPPANRTPANGAATDRVPTDGAPTDHTQSHHAPGDHAATDRDPGDHPATDHAASDHAPSDRAASDHAPSDRAASHHAPTDHAPGDHAASDHASSDHTPSHHDPTDHAPGDHAATDHAASDRAASHHAATDRAPGDRAATRFAPTATT